MLSLLIYHSPKPSQAHHYILDSYQNNLKNNTAIYSSVQDPTASQFHSEHSG